MADASAPWWPVVLTLLFWAGVAFVLSRVVISILSILRVINNGERVREEKAQSIYGKSLKELSPEELTQINDLVPLSISETDMKKG